ncbi:D-glycero-alpha-D-manno-heptose-1,7-bisphosphate 7-phosphatase [Desulfonatronum thiodismutans]|uniref:D-glycero-alpha-D-manno-heptose-1,7-bisphosphate 7-phosphatase n=1 Tax=Desulfonatronum thiodismutans TaxID=159290 RepID=UPI0004ABD40A|nr:HAD family hydrolase [Desulfonatronum thiodismutans]
MHEQIHNILLDRDGTVIEERHYLADPNGVQLIPGAGPVLRALMDSGRRLFLVTNQSGIGRGYFSLAQYEAVQGRLLQLLGEEGVELAATVMCPHAPDDGCSCRKPLPGLWEELQAAYGLDPARSIMIGDKVADIRFARSSGLALAALVLTGHGRQTALNLGLPNPLAKAVALHPLTTPDHPDILAPDLGAVADLLLKT